MVHYSISQYTDITYSQSNLIADRCLLHKFTKNDYWRGRRVTCQTGLTPRYNYQIIAQLMNTYLINNRTCSRALFTKIGQKLCRMLKLKM